MKIQTGLSEKSRKLLYHELVKYLANTYAIYLKTQNYHWNITGSQFYSLHLLLEKQYEELADAIDEIAERIRALGFVVEASFAHFKKQTSIPEEGKLLKAPKMIEQLALSHEILIRHGRELASLAEKELDAATVDLLGRRLGSHEKFAWMLRSQL